MAQHMTRVLGKAKMRRLVECLGYADDLKADARDTIDDYGYDDNWQGSRVRNKRFVRIPWNMLIHLLAKKLRQRGVRIHTRHPIRNLSTHPKLKSARAILLATTIGQTRSMLKQSRIDAKLLDTYVRSQPFLYAYGNMDPGDTPLPSYTVVGGVVQKMIPMGGKVLMMAYADNANAIRLKGMTAAQIADVASRTGNLQPLRPPYMKHFIREGTHYFRPYDRREFPTRAHLLRAMHAELNAKRGNKATIAVIGEAVSEHHQGWVEGALEAAQRGVSLI